MPEGPPARRRCDPGGDTQRQTNDLTWMHGIGPGRHGDGNPLETHGVNDIIYGFPMVL